MLLFKLIRLGQLLGHSVRVKAFNGDFDNILGQILGHSVQANTSYKIIDRKLGHIINT